MVDLMHQKTLPQSESAGTSQLANLQRQTQMHLKSLVEKLIEFSVSQSSKNDSTPATEKEQDSIIKKLKSELDSKNLMIAELIRTQNQASQRVGADRELEQAEQMLLKTLSTIESREISARTQTIYKNLVLSQGSEARARLNKIQKMGEWDLESDSEEGEYDYRDYQASEDSNN